MEWVPDRGEVVWITLTPSAGHEQSGRRLALVLSPGSYNSVAQLAIMCPVTSQVKGYPFEVAIPDGLPVKGVVLSDQARSLDWKERRAEPQCSLPDDTVDAVLRRLARLTGPES